MTALPVTMLSHIPDSRCMVAKGTMPLTLIYFLLFPPKNSHTIPEAIGLLTSHWFICSDGCHLLTCCHNVGCGVCGGARCNPRQCTTSSPPLIFGLLVYCFIKIVKITAMLPATMLPHILDARYMAAKGTMPLTLIYFYSCLQKYSHTIPEN